MAYKFYPAKKYRWTTYSLEFIKEMLIKRRENQKDCIVLITGSRGEGKSTLADKLSFMFDNFNPYENIVYSKEALFREIKKKLGIIIADEAVVNAARGNTMSRANKLLFEVFTINRDNLNIVFLLLPFVEDFDTKILQYVSLWLHIDKRGLAIVMLPSNKGIFGKRNWDIVNMKKIYDEFVKEDKGGRSMPYWCYENFVGYIRFGKLTVKQQEIVDEIKTLRKNENLDKTSKEEIITEVKELDNYAKYSAKKLAELVLKGEIRSYEQFVLNCTEMKVMPEEMIKKADKVFKDSNVQQTVKQKLKEYSKSDNLIKF